MSPFTKYNEMVEIHVKQRTKEWFDLRRSVVLTASRFGDALGVGKGRPYDFFVSLISDDNSYQSDENNTALRHGTAMEAVIREAYQLLTGYQTRETGFWVPMASDPLNGIIGVSPDDLVIMGNAAGDGAPQILGLAEYKAPLHRLYSENSSNICGIPRQYMAQIQGQMAVTRTSWCDFMAICTKTRELMLKRVYFQPIYWKYASSRLEQFASIVQEARKLKSKGMEPLDSAGARTLKLECWTTAKSERFPGEDQIMVEDLVEIDGLGRYKGLSGSWINFDLLIGTEIYLPANLREYASGLLQEIDEDIELAAIEGL